MCNWRSVEIYYLVRQAVNTLFIIQRKSKNGTTNYDCKQFVLLGIDTARNMRFEIRVLLNRKLDRSFYPLVLRYSNMLITIIGNLRLRCIFWFNDVTESGVFSQRIARILVFLFAYLTLRLFFVLLTEPQFCSRNITGSISCFFRYDFAIAKTNVLILKLYLVRYGF